VTRKDFELIAKVIANLDGIRNSDHEFVAERFADALAGTNSQFDRKRFLAASGIEVSR
jgi:hypothetical protein